MLWYFKNKEPFEYPQKSINNPLTNRFHKSVYENSDEMEVFYSFQYMKENNISDLSVVFPIEDLSVNYGNQQDINIDFCKQNNIHYRYENRSGGCMVLFPGNIITYDVYPTDNFLRQHSFLQEFVEWLQQRSINATTNNNDLMIDGYKVIGTVSQNLPAPYEGWVYFATSISINVDEELISNICTKDSVKAPGALSTYGITTEEVMDWVLDWFDKHKSWEVEDEA